MGKKTVRGHDIANRFVYSLSKGSIHAILPLPFSIYFLKIVSFPFNLQVL